MQIGPYAIQEELARGGQGVVYRAQDTRLNRPVVLKLLQVDSAHQARRLLREAQAMARLRHPHLVPLHETGEYEGKPYLVLPFVSGESLQERLERGGPLPLEAALRFTAQVGQALGAAHAEGLVHRDVKPANVLVDEQDRALLTDFGLVKNVGPGQGESLSLSVRGHFLGTPGYWPPEQAYGDHDKVGPAADVYALGALLYALLTGRAPRNAQSIQAALHAFETPVEPISGFRENVPRWVERLVRACLAAEPQRRPPLAEVLRALEGEEFRAASRALPAGAWVAALVVGLLSLSVAVTVALVRPRPSVASDPAPAADRSPAEAPPTLEQPDPAPSALDAARARLAELRVLVGEGRAGAQELESEAAELRRVVAKGLADELLAWEPTASDWEAINASAAMSQFPSMERTRQILLAGRTFMRSSGGKGKAENNRLGQLCLVIAKRGGSIDAFYELAGAAARLPGLSGTERLLITQELLERAAHAGSAKAIADLADVHCRVARRLPAGPPGPVAGLTAVLELLGEDRFRVHTLSRLGVEKQVRLSCAVAFELIANPPAGRELQLEQLEQARAQIVDVQRSHATVQIDPILRALVQLQLQELERRIEAVHKG